MVDPRDKSIQKNPVTLKSFKKTDNIALDASLPADEENPIASERMKINDVASDATPLADSEAVSTAQADKPSVPSLLSLPPIIPPLLSLYIPPPPNMFCSSISTPTVKKLTPSACHCVTTTPSTRHSSSSSP
jgi:hypothetical protein